VTSEALIPSVRASLQRATERLTQAGCDTPRLDAEVLLASSLDTDRAGLVVGGRDLVGAPALRRFEEMVARRAEREPVAYIVGRKGFRFLELRCDRRALIPRPETELLVEVALTLPAGVRVLDVGTGTGAVALAVASERPDLDVTGSDLSSDALALARDNARRLGVRVRFTHADLRDGLAADVVLANLPYVPDGTVLAPEIARYEPASALYAGADGLSLIRRLCAQLAGVSVVALEHGSEQGAAVAELVRTGGFADVRVLRDLAGLDRVTVGRR
jgi:release factor glutamine methyltransferase